MIFFRNLFKGISAADNGSRHMRHANFDRTLSCIFGILSNGNEVVLRDIKRCISDTEVYFSEHSEDFEKRGIKYSGEAEKWIKLIAAVDSLKKAGYAVELSRNASAEDFTGALDGLLRKNGIDFSLKNLNFEPQKGIPDHAALFNEYAGQSGITVCFFDLYGNSYVMCATMICDYARAADAASMVGISLSSRCSVTIV